MSTPSPASGAFPPRRGPSRLKLVFWLLIVPIVLVAAYFAIFLNWNYSSGERAGWVQKFSKKGWICKTWEGEMAMVTMPGSTPEKFLFTVKDDKVAQQINRLMGKRVTVNYDQKVGLPTSCFGETRHFVSGVSAVDEIPLAPGIIVPTPNQAPATAPQAPSAPAQAVPESPVPSPQSEYSLPPAETSPPAPHSPSK